MRAHLCAHLEHENGAQNALGAADDRLAKLIDSWADLPEHAKDAMAAMVDSAMRDVARHRGAEQPN